MDVHCQALQCTFHARRIRQYRHALLGGCLCLMLARYDLREVSCGIAFAAKASAETDPNRRIPEQRRAREKFAPERLETELRFHCWFSFVQDSNYSISDQMNTAMGYACTRANEGLCLRGARFQFRYRRFIM